MAPISTKVIALLTTMLEHVQTNPDDSAETEALIKATLQSISVNKRSAIRKMGDAFLDFADERPALALGCVMFLGTLVAQSGSAITTLAEQYGLIPPRKMQIEVKDPETGMFQPAGKNIVSQLGYASYAKGFGVEFEEARKPPQSKEFVTESGHLVSINRDSSAVPASESRRPMPGATERTAGDRRKSGNECDGNRSGYFGSGYFAQPANRSF